MSSTATIPLPHSALVTEKEKDQIIATLQQENQQLRAFKNTVHSIVTNKDMTYSDRVLWIITLDNHPNEMLACKPFQPNISRLRQESGVGSDTTTKFFASMAEAGAIKYSNKAQEPQTQGKNWSSVSTVIPQPTHAKANTRAAALRIKQREETTKRRIARKLVIIPCPECGSENLDDAYSAIVPICKSCNHVSMDRQETILSKQVRIIEETLIPADDTTPSHEFSDDEADDQGDEYDDDDELTSCTQEQPTDSATATSHEFSEVTDDQADENDKRPNDSQEPITTALSHEFSEVGASTDFVTATPLNHEFSTVSTSLEPTRPSHEFSETPTRSTTPSSASPISSSHQSIATPSHEFSEGMSVTTPYGTGIISMLWTTNNHQYCRIRYRSNEPDKTFSRNFELSQITPSTEERR